jgi:hypothetical protein
MKRNNGNVVLVGQLGVECDEGGIRLICNELPDVLFVRCQFQMDTTLPFLGSDTTGLSTLLAKGIDPRRADGILAGGIFAGHAALAIFQYAFASI